MEAAKQQRHSSCRDGIFFEPEGTSGFPFDYRISVPQKEKTSKRTVNLYRVRRMNWSLRERNRENGNYNFDNTPDGEGRRSASNRRSRIGENNGRGNGITVSGKICAGGFTEHLPYKYRKCCGLTACLHFLHRPYVVRHTEKVFTVFRTIHLLVYRDPSRVTFHRDGALVASHRGSNPLPKEGQSEFGSAAEFARR